ncbi:GNAT family N-acetyltransferase [Kribbella monticola]|uniref:GNAT family N-acetyltransferase n=1 Tax=Kribbella monticola TaxID=2185285 RepID=UPI0018E4E9DD|nr:GNAT family N-acetyltransferase [Kribbella monticola]
MIAVRLATAADVEQLLQLTEEMDRFYGSTDFESVELRRRQLRDALFGDTPAATALLAVEEDTAVGFAAYSFLWPAAGLTRSLYLKELYVSEGQQRRGVGRSLMEALFGVARQHDCSRVEWTTDRDNPGAQAFYKTFGVEPKDGKIFYRLEQ